MTRACVDEPKVSCRPVTATFWPRRERRPRDRPARCEDSHYSDFDYAGPGGSNIRREKRFHKDPQGSPDGCGAHRCELPLARQPAWLFPSADILPATNDQDSSCYLEATCAGSHPAERAKTAQPAWAVAAGPAAVNPASTKSAAWVIAQQDWPNKIERKACPPTGRRVSSRPYPAGFHPREKSDEQEHRHHRQPAAGGVCLR
jgi:hypothetical protein